MATLPDPEIAREWLATMTLIRRFEERAGEMYARAKVGGFLHLSIGEEATIVGSARALRESDYLVSTYRSHGHALVRGTPPENVMAELFGRVDGCSGGRGGSMHMFDLARRFMGGYGIVGGNLPIAAGIALACDYQGSEDVTLCAFGDGASNQGRSEEHTSELQSHVNLVCRLLLEKKKKNKKCIYQRKKKKKKKKKQN